MVILCLTWPEITMLETRDGEDIRSGLSRPFNKWQMRYALFNVLRFRVVGCKASSKDECQSERCTLNHGTTGSEWIQVVNELCHLCPNTACAAQITPV
jgi:hypothetical protein